MPWLIYIGGLHFSEKKGDGMEGRRGGGELGGEERGKIVIGLGKIN